MRCEAFISATITGEIASLEPEKLRTVIDGLEQSLEPYQDDQAVIFPMETVMILAEDYG